MQVTASSFLNVSVCFPYTTQPQGFQSKTETAVCPNVSIVGARNVVMCYPTTCRASPHSTIQLQFGTARDFWHVFELFMCFLSCSEPPYTTATTIKDRGRNTNENSSQHTRLPCKSAPKDTITTSCKTVKHKDCDLFTGGRMKDRNWRNGEPGLVRNAGALGGLNHLDWLSSKSEPTPSCPEGDQGDSVSSKQCPPRPLEPY